MKRLVHVGLFALVLTICGCRRETDPVDYGNFPEEIGEILVTNCATAGCHDDASFEAEGRLSLSSWESMFKGSRAGAALVPFQVDQSYILNFINTDTNLGIVQLPTMPLNLPPLSAEQYIKIRDWVAAGAPSAEGQVMWSDNPARGKIYVVNQGCDQVSILDRETRLVMRYVQVGIDPVNIEAAHNVKVSPDGRHWYVVYVVGNPTIEKYDAMTDQFVARVQVGNGSWNTIDISADGHYAVSPNLSSGNAVLIDLNTMTLAAQYNIGGSPHGVRFKPGGGAIYFTQQEGSTLSKLVYTDVTNPDGIETIDLVQHIAKPDPLREMGPHEILYTPDHSKYMVTCSYQDQVRFYQASNDSLLAVVNVPNFPVEMDVAVSAGLAFVTCMEDTSTHSGDPSKRGSVAVINMNTMQLVTQVYTGYQPHGIAVDEEKGLVYVAHRNVNVNGPAPHHSSNCGGRNGNITAISIGSLSLLPRFKHELSVDPYSIGLRK